MRSKWDWHECGEKSSKFFLNLKKSRVAQFEILQEIKKVECYKELINNFLTFIKAFFQKISKNEINVSKNKIVQILKLVSISQVKEDQSRGCKFISSVKDLLVVLKSIPNNKSPGNDGLTKKFYEVFLEDIKTPLTSTFKSAFDKDELTNSQKQVVIKLTEKEDRDKRLIQNWRPILLNVDLKILSKALADLIKKYLPFLILSNETAPVEGRYISEGRRLFSDILQVIDSLNFRELVVAVDI